MRDKPRWARSLRRVDAAGQAVAQTRALMAVDDLVGRVVRALEQRNELANTAVIYTSDNGLAWGEHRWLWKSAPWEESIGVPLVVRADGLATRGEERLSRRQHGPRADDRGAGGPAAAADGRALARAAPAG